MSTVDDLGTGDPRTGDIGARLRARRLRLTTQRERILAVVDELGHATPDEIAAEEAAPRKRRRRRRSTPKPE